MKKTLAALCLFLALLLPLAGLGEEELLKNGGFEWTDEYGDPESWYSNSYREEAGYSRLQITREKAHSGEQSALIENASQNDARFITTVRVEPNSYYRLSGYVLVEEMSAAGNGANFAVEEIYAFSPGLYDTEGEWRYLEWYGRTGPDQATVTLGARVGGYGAESVGKAYFDDVSLVKVETLPEGAIPAVWYPVVSAPQSGTAGDSQKGTGWFCLLAVFFLLLCLLFRPALNRKSFRFVLPCLAALLLLALALRIVLALRVAGYAVDIGCFSAWSQRMAAVGPAEFYQEDMFCDYPPGYMLLCWPVGLMMNAFGATGTGVGQIGLLLVKLPPILFDMIGAVLLYAYGQKRLGQAPALYATLLYALNPAALAGGAAWGQGDSALAFLMLLCCIFAMEEKWQVAVPVYTAAVLCKPQALLFGPVLAVWLMRVLLSRKDRAQWKRLLLGAGISLVLAAAVILPFSPSQSFGWVWRLYTETLGSYAYAVLNTANLYYLLAANWIDLSRETGAALPVVTALLSLLPSAAALFLRMRRREKESFPSFLRSRDGLLCALTLAFALYQFAICAAGCTWALYGYGMMALVYGAVAVCILDDPSPERLPGYLAFALTGIYVLGVKVHERYLFPALALFLLSYCRTKDRRMLWLCVGFSATTFLNTAVVLDNSILFGSAQGHLNDDTLFLNVLLCLTNLLLTGLAFWTMLTPEKSFLPVGKEKETRQAARERKFAIPDAYREMLLRPKDARLRLCWKDWAVMGVAMVLYAALAFANLGSTIAPQRGMVSSSFEEQIVFELPQEQDFYFLYYAGVSYNSFSINVSDDGENWSPTYPCEMREGLCYRWNYALESWLSESGGVVYGDNSPQGRLTLHGRYLRLNAEAAGLNLFEVVFRSAESGETIHAKVASHTGARPEMLNEPQDPEALLDEQETCVGEPSWYNGTYFDEIYHARTAYEHLHGQKPYETTHPPLGKLLMALGIAVFGMTPFGWRFAGALVGVLMLPALYLLAMQLFKKRKLAAASMLALALDLMHYTQTRIATIDSFPVLFILLSFWCMTRYLQTDLFALEENEKPRLTSRAFWKSQIPLLFSGLFMGLSIASKWIGLYSAVGLAALFFTAAYRQYRAGSFAYCITESEREKMPEEAGRRIENARRFTLNRVALTCGFCLLYFVLLPALIYYLSYIPYLSPTGPVTLERLVHAQVGMLNYHSTPGMGMDHPFYSPWWQWPLILKPMWFAQDKFEPAGMASTIMCMGNPWVFYLGAVAMLGVIWAFLKKYLRLRREGIELREGDGDLTLYVLVVGFAAQFLPWVLVPRGTYMYHYFASVPFIILATFWMLGRLPQRTQNAALAVYAIGAAAFFVMFFPYASGLLTSADYLDAMKWVSRLYGGKWFNLYY